MEIDWATLTPIVLALLAFATSALGVWRQRKRDEIEQSEAEARIDKLVQERWASDFTRLEQRLTESEKAREKLELELTGLKALYTQACTEIDELKQQLTAERADKETLRARLAEVETENTHLRERVNMLEEKNFLLANADNGSEPEK